MYVKGKKISIPSLIWLYWSEEHSGMKKGRSNGWISKQSKHSAVIWGDRTLFWKCTSWVLTSCRRALLSGDPVGQGEQGRVYSWLGILEILLACLFPRCWKEPSYCKDNYYSIESACISLLGTSFSASVHYITHLTNALWAKIMIGKQRSGIFKRHKKKRMQDCAGLVDCDQTATMFRPPPFLSAFPGLTHPQSLTASHVHFPQWVGSTHMPCFTPKIRYIRLSVTRVLSEILWWQ